MSTKPYDLAVAKEIRQRRITTNGFTLLSFWHETLDEDTGWPAADAEVIVLRAAANELLTALDRQKLGSSLLVTAAIEVLEDALAGVTEDTRDATQKSEVTPEELLGLYLSHDELRQKLREQAKRIEALQTKLLECADEIEPYVRFRYGADSDDGVHPAQRLKFDRDMEFVTEIRSLATPDADDGGNG